jgi:hypothetical protein
MIGRMVMVLSLYVAAQATTAIAQNAPAGPAGLLTMVSGQVQIVRAGDSTPRPARTADVIAPGDRVITGRGSEATFVFCPDSRAAKMLPETEVQFDSTTFRVKKGKLSDERKLPSCFLPANLTLSGASQLQSGALRLRGSDLILLSPSRTKTIGLRPKFQWEPVDGASTYDVKLMDREERILWQHNTSSTAEQYPDDAPALAWGEKYWWRVTARDRDDTLTEVGSYFQVLPKDQAEQLRSTEEGLQHLVQQSPADNTPLFLLAFLYDENGVLDQAARTYSELAQRIGPQGWLQSRLADLMNKLGWNKVDSDSPR